MRPEKRNDPLERLARDLMNDPDFAPAGVHFGWDDERERRRLRSAARHRRRRRPR